MLRFRHQHSVRCVWPFLLFLCLTQVSLNDCLNCWVTTTDRDVKEQSAMCMCMCMLHKLCILVLICVFCGCSCCAVYIVYTSLCCLLWWCFILPLILTHILLLQSDIACCTCCGASCVEMFWALPLFGIILVGHYRGRLLFIYNCSSVGSTGC